MEMLNCKVNGIAVSVPKGATILEAARAAGVEIPTLCYMKEKNEIGACRICVVEATGARGLVTACVYPVTEGMEISTNTQKVRDARKTTLELILSTHNMSCLSCVRSTNCELQKLCLEYGVDQNAFVGFKPTYELDYSTPHLGRDNNKCTAEFPLYLLEKCFFLQNGKPILFDLNGFLSRIAQFHQLGNEEILLLCHIFSERREAFDHASDIGRACGKRFK